MTWIYSYESYKRRKAFFTSIGNVAWTQWMWLDFNRLRFFRGVRKKKNLKRAKRIERANLVRATGIHRWMIWIKWFLSITLLSHKNDWQAASAEEAYPTRRGLQDETCKKRPTRSTASGERVVWVAEHEIFNRRTVSNFNKAYTSSISLAT